MTSTTASVEVRAGIPGIGLEQLEDGRYSYPSLTSNFVKLFRNNGFTVTFDHERAQRVEVSHNAADAWLPVLAFSQAVLANIPANIISSIIMNFFGAAGIKRTTLHVKFVVVSSDGSVEKFEAHGPGDDVVEAIDAFQRKHGRRGTR